MTQSTSRTAIIADDHPIILFGAMSILSNMGYQILSTHHNGTQALNAIRATQPQLALLDVQMPGICGIDILEEIRKHQLSIKVIIYTMFTDAHLFHRAKELGVNGYLLKEFATTELNSCVKNIEKGRDWYSPEIENKITKSSRGFNPKLYCRLTTTEKTVLKAIADKKTTKQIAAENFICIKTVESHRRNIINKLDLGHERNTLLIYAIENKGFFSLSESE